MISDLTIQSGSAGLRASIGGEGPGVVLLHAGVADRRMWRDAMAHLSVHRTAIAYDRRGFGETTAPDEPFRHIDDLGSVLRHLGRDKPVLIGCSQGGRIAIDFALERPDRIGGLILVAPAISGAPDPAEYPPPVRPVLAALEAAESKGDIDEINRIEAHLWLDGPLSSEGRVGGEARRLFLDMNQIALRHPELTKQIKPGSAMTRLSRIELPTLVVCGDLDFPHLQDRCWMLASALPKARHAIMAGCAHLPNMEQPVAFNRLVETFLNGL